MDTWREPYVERYSEEGARAGLLVLIQINMIHLIECMHVALPIFR